MKIGVVDLRNLLPTWLHHLNWRPQTHNDFAWIKQGPSPHPSRWADRVHVLRRHLNYDKLNPSWLVIGVGAENEILICFCAILKRKVFCIQLYLWLWIGYIDDIFLGKKQKWGNVFSGFTARSLCSLACKVTLINRRWRGWGQFHSFTPA